jgi:hypothetical protein
VLEHHGGEELCEHPRVAVTERVLNVLDLEKGFSDADLYLKLMLLLLGGLEEEEMSSPIFLVLNIYPNHCALQAKLHRNRKLNLYRNFY